MSEAQSHEQTWLRTMHSFDPMSPAIVFDELTDQFYRWDPAPWHASWSGFAAYDHEGGGTREWQGCLLSGWLPVDEFEAQFEFISGPALKNQSPFRHGRQILSAACGVTSGRLNSPQP